MALSMFQTTPGQIIRDQFSAFEDDGVTKRSGLTTPGDFTVTVWRDGVVSGLSTTISEIGTSGEYLLSYTPSATGVWVVEVRINFSDDIYKSTAFVPTATDLTDVKSDLERVLGLLHENAMLDNQTYDANDQLLTARLRVFSSASDVPTNPGNPSDPNTTQQYSIQAEYTALNRPRKYTVKRVL